MPRRSHKRKSKYVTKRSLPFQLMKYAETKRLITDFDDEIIDLAGNTFDLSLITQGETQSTREGNEIQFRSVYCRFYTEVAGTPQSGQAVYMRFILYSPRLANLSVPPVTEMRGFVDMDNYIVWQDKWVQVGTDRLHGALVTIKHKWKPYMKLLWNGNGATTHRKGSVFLQIIRTSTAEVDPPNVLLNGFATAFFKDI